MSSPSDELRIAIIITTFIVLSLVAFILFLVVIFQVRKKKVKAQLDKEILSAQLEIQEQTFKNISQEIHDNIGQALSLAKLNLNTFPATLDEKLQLKLSDTKTLVSKAIKDLRSLSNSMHGDKIAELGLQHAIENELQLLQNSGQFKTNLEVAGEPFKIDDQKEIVVFRMLQESLNNCIKHAKATVIFVKLNNQKSSYIISITDNGIGFDKTTLQSTQTGIGLRNMQNRAALINAQFAIISAREKGTTIEISLNK